MMIPRTSPDISHHHPFPQKTPSYGRRPTYLIALSLLPILLFPFLQSSLLITLPRSLRLTSRDFLSPSSFTPPSLPPSAHIYAYTSPSSSSNKILFARGDNSSSPLISPSPPVQLDIVVSYYDEPASGVQNVINWARREVPHWSSRSIVYHKGLKFPEADEDSVREGLQFFMEGKDESERLSGVVDVVAATKNAGAGWGDASKAYVSSFLIRSS